MRSKPNYKELEKVKNRVRLQKLRTGEKLQKEQQKENGQGLLNAPKLHHQFKDKERERTKIQMRNKRLQDLQWKENQNKQNRIKMRCIRKNAEYNQNEAAKNKMRIKILRCNPQYAINEGKKKHY